MMITPAMQSSSIIRTFTIFILTITGTTGIEKGCSTDRTQFNYVVSITDICTVEHLCSGAIINELHILTAANCVHRRSPENLIIFAGSNIVIDAQSITRRVSEIHIHEKYDPDRLRSGSRRALHKKEAINDIAVIKVEVPYTWKEYIASKSLPPLIHENWKYGYTSGWGRNDLGKKLQSLIMRVDDADHCEEVLAYHGADEFCAEPGGIRGFFFPDDRGGPLEITGCLYGIMVSPSDIVPQRPIYVDLQYHRTFIQNFTTP